MKTKHSRICIVGSINNIVKNDIKNHIGAEFILGNDMTVDAVVIVGNGLDVPKDYAEKAFSKGRPVYLYILPAEGARGNNFPNTYPCGERTKSGAHIMKVGNNWTDIGDGTVAMMPC